MIRRKRKATGRKKKTERQKLKERLWKLVSEYSRRKDADHNGYTACVSCGTTRPWKEMHGGHFIPKGKGSAVYFEETNIHSQCPGCNIFREGAYIEYTQYMIKRYGMKHVEWLQSLVHRPFKLSIPVMLDLEVTYQKKLDQLNQESAA